MKLNLEDIKAYIEFDLVPFNSNAIFIFIIPLWIFGLVCGLLSAYQMLTTIIIITMNIAFTVVCVFYYKRQTIFNQHLVYGSYGLNFSIIMLFASYKYAYVDKVPNLFIFILYIIIYLIAIAIYYIVATKMISSGYYRGIHNPSKSLKANIALSMLGGLILYPLIRVCLIVSNQETRVAVLSILLFISSLLTCSGLKHLLKCYYQKKYKIDDTLENHFNTEKLN